MSADRRATRKSSRASSNSTLSRPPNYDGAVVVSVEANSLFAVSVEDSPAKFVVRSDLGHELDVFARRGSRASIIDGLNQLLSSENKEFVGCWRVDANIGQFTLGAKYSDRWTLTDRETPFFRKHLRVPNKGAELLYIDPAEGERITVTPGAQYRARARFGLHRCTATFDVEFFDAAGRSLTRVSCKPLNDGLGGARLRYYATVDQTFRAPDAASSARVSIVVNDDLEGNRPDSLLLFTHVHFGREISVGVVKKSNSHSPEWMAQLRKLDAAGAVELFLPIPAELRDGRDYVLTVHTSDGLQVPGGELRYASSRIPTALRTNTFGRYAWPVYLGVASIPSREPLLKRMLESVIDQVDHVFVYLNNYNAVPDWLNNDRITVFSSEDFGDLRDNGKFFGLDLIPRGAYFFTCDDDIFYPSDYVWRLIERVEFYGRNVIVGVHGVIFAPKPHSFFARTVSHFGRGLNVDIPVSALGTGTIAFHTSTISLSPEELGSGGMADLKFGAVAKARGVGMIALARPPGWLQDLGAGEVLNSEEPTLYEEARSQPAPTAFLRRNVPWGFEPIRHATEVVREKLTPAAANLVEFGLALQSDSLASFSPSQAHIETITLAEQISWSPLAAHVVRSWLKDRFQ